MKIKPEHFEHMQSAIEEVLAAEPSLPERYRAGDFPGAERTRDVNVRFRWDMVRFAGLTKWICDTLYPYANDDHIDTALRRIVPKVS